MTVYVDPPLWSRHGTRWCHLVADTHEELEAFARRIELKPEWIQKAGTRHEHYDLPPEARSRAIELGAVETTIVEMATVLTRKRDAERSSAIEPV